MMSVTKGLFHETDIRISGPSTPLYTHVPDLKVSPENLCCSSVLLCCVPLVEFLYLPVSSLFYTIFLCFLVLQNGAVSAAENNE